MTPSIAKGDLDHKKSSQASYRITEMHNYYVYENYQVGH